MLRELAQSLGEFCTSCNTILTACLMTAFGFVARLFQPDISCTGSDMRSTLACRKPLPHAHPYTDASPRWHSRWRALFVQGMSTALVLSSLATGVAAQTRSELANLVFDVELLVNTPEDDASSENSAASTNDSNGSDAAASPQGEGQGEGAGAADDLLLTERDPRDLQQEID